LRTPSKKPAVTTRTSWATCVSRERRMPGAAWRWITCLAKGDGQCPWMNASG
jgi:hypothetical protein